MGNRNNFTDLIKELLKHNIKCITIEVPGHGSRFEDPPENITMQNTINIMKDIITENVDREKEILVVFGFSMGAYITMAFAGNFPDLADAIIVGGAGTNMTNANILLTLMGIPYKILPKST